MIDAHNHRRANDITGHLMVVAVDHFLLVSTVGRRSGDA